MRPADFSEAIRKTIAIRSNNLCNNPSCKQSTLCESQSDDLVINLGKACHIEAASPNGPRYNPNTTEEYRKSIKNAIWLCPVCADRIDKDYKSYSVEQLKEWKRNAEQSCSPITGLRVLAVANSAGGVGTSTMTAYLAQACVMLTGSNVLCISAGGFDYCGSILQGGWDYRNSPNYIFETNIKSLYYMSDNAIKKLADEKKWTMGRSDLCADVREMAIKHKIKYIFIDYGKGDPDIKMELAQLATDFVIPIGEHVYTSSGIDHISSRYLASAKNHLRVWPVFSIGLTMSNTTYRRTWYRNLRNSLNSICKLPNTTLIEPTIIIPKSNYVDGSFNIFSDRKTEHVAEAYLLLSAEILGICDNNSLNGTEGDSQ